MQGLSLNIIKNFKMATAEHRTKHGALCGETGATAVKPALFRFPAQSESHRRDKVAQLGCPHKKQSFFMMVQTLSLI